MLKASLVGKPSPPTMVSSDDSDWDESGSSPGRRRGAAAFLAGVGVDRPRVDRHQDNQPAQEPAEPEDDLTEHIRRSRSIITFFRDTHGRVYSDSLCFFRCLWSFLNNFNRKPVAAELDQLYARAAARLPFPPNPPQFTGVHPTQVTALEELFEVDIIEYTLTVGLPARGPDFEGDMAEERAIAAEAGEARREANRAIARDERGYRVLSNRDAELNRMDAELDNDEYRMTRADREFVIDDDVPIERDTSDSDCSEMDIQSDEDQGFESETEALDMAIRMLDSRADGEQLQANYVYSNADDNRNPAELNTTSSSSSDEDEFVQPLNRNRVFSSSSCDSDAEHGNEQTEEHLDARDEINIAITRRSIGAYKNPMHLLKHNNHYCLIRNVKTAARFYRCDYCDHIFTRHDNFRRHILKCTGDVKERFPGGGYGPSLTIFDKLLDEGIDIPLNDRFFSFRIDFDFECCQPDYEKPGFGNLRWIKKCIPSVVNVCSNVTDNPDTEEAINGVPADDLAFTKPVTIIDWSENPYNLMDKLIDQIHVHCDDASRRMRIKFQPVIQRLETKLEELNDARGVLMRLKEAEQPNEDEIKAQKDKVAVLGRWEKLHSEFCRWLDQIPVLGFNSAGFDLVLIRKWFVTTLMRREIKIESVITRGSSYLMISTPKFVLLDILSYVAGGVKYSQFLTMFNVEEQKGAFCHKWFTNVRKLLQTTIPPIEEFDNDLTGEKMDPDFYRWICSEWERLEMKMVADLVVWYSEKDTRPMLRAIARMYKIFKERMGLDMFKMGCISLAGIALRFMFQGVGPAEIFPLWPASHAQYRKAIQSNIVGGPALTFTREMIAGVSKIRGGKTCEGSGGIDANALYPSAFLEDLPCGFPATYAPKNPDDSVDLPFQLYNDVDDTAALEVVEANMNQVFQLSRPHARHFYEVVWVTWKFSQIAALPANVGRQLTLRHSMNGGQKTFVFGSDCRRPVDGWIPQLGVILQYHGCRFHGHKDRPDCPNASSLTPEERAEKEAATEETNRLLLTTGHTVITSYHCDFMARYRAEMVLYPDGALARHFDRFKHPVSKYNLTAREILNSIEQDVLFGILELDIQVWRSNEATEEFPPVFKNTLVSVGDVGPTMKAYCGDKIFTRPRRALIGSFFGKKIMLTTPQVKQYLELGFMKVTRVHSLIQYSRTRCFSPLVEQMADLRRQAALNPSQTALAETFKKTANSMYGKCCTREDLHETVQFMTSKKAALAVNKSTFRKLDRVDNGVYEVHSAKSEVKYRLPVELAFFVYGYAKMRMIDVYFNFLYKMVGRANFEMVTMDTDSLYFGMSGTSLYESMENKDDIETLKKYLCASADFPLELGFKDKFTPGLMKEEYRGGNIRALNPKTYIAWSETTEVDAHSDQPSTSHNPSTRVRYHNIKQSSKGVSKKLNKYSPSDYKAALKKKLVTGKNRGFRRLKELLMQYRQERIALTFTYVKRRVQADGIHTDPLMI